MPGTGFIHRLLTALQVIKKRTVWIWKLSAKMLTGLEQACGSPAMQGALADAEAIRREALDSPRRGRCHGWIDAGVTGSRGKASCDKRFRSKGTDPLRRRDQGYPDRPGHSWTAAAITVLSGI